MPKVVVEKFRFRELKIVYVKFLTPIKIFFIGVFNVGGCLARCLTFRTLLTSNFETFAGKSLCWSHFLIKLQFSRSASLFKSN